MTVHTFQTMGTVASLRSPSALLPAQMLERIESCFQHMDNLYSLYKPDSVLSHINDGSLLLRDAPVTVRDAYAEAMGWRSETEGNFTPNAPNGHIDLSGLVKAKAIDQAGRICDEYLTDWLLNVGGDVLARGRDSSGVWRCGISDPADRQAVLEIVDMSNRRCAVATSGTAERGEHVWRNDLDSTLKQVSVISDSIIVSDVLATAILAGGIWNIAEEAAHWNARIIAVTQTDEVIDAVPANFG